MNNPIESILQYADSRYVPEEYPCLLTQMREWRKTRPLDGLRILDATPLFTNTLLKYVPLLAAGAHLTAAIHRVNPFDPVLPDLLREWGIPVSDNAVSGDYDCILDCTGAHAHLHSAHGFAELTRSGFYHYQHTLQPVILVDDSRIKAIETCLGTGDGFLRGMKQCGYTDFQGKNILIFGFGKVGRGIAFYAHREGAHILVADDPSVSVPKTYTFINRYDTAAVHKAVSEAWCVVTATGIRNAMQAGGIAGILRDGKQIVAAMGIEDEWGDSLPAERILNHGAPLNFILSEPTRIRYIDPTMALSNAAALELATKKLPSGIQKINPDVEKPFWNILEHSSLIADELKNTEL